MHRYVVLHRLFAFLVVCMIVSPWVGTSRSYAESYPSKPIRWIIPFPAGGGMDIIARPIAQRASGSWGQPVVVDNRPGATGAIGTLLAARATPDGYTFLMGNTATHGTNPSLFKNLPYDPVKDFVPVTLIAMVPMVLLVNPSLPVNTVSELIALAKARPRQLSFGSAGKGSTPHLAGELLKSMAGIDIIHVPYKGSPAGLLDLMGGRISMYFSNVLSAVPLLKSGKLKALGVTSAQRSPAIATVPTISESGLTGYEGYNWYVVVAPAGTPRTIIGVLHKGITAALSSRDIQDNLLRDGALLIASTPEQCRDFIKKEIDKYARITKEAGIAPE